MGLSNVIMVRHQKEYDARKYAESLRDLDNVVWSIVGMGGMNDGTDVRTVREMATQYPNWRGVMMDDFFLKSERDTVAIYSVDDLKSIQQQLHLGDRKLICGSYSMTTICIYRSESTWSNAM